MKNQSSIYDVLKNCKKNDVVSNGKFFWKVVETEKNEDCVIAVPLKTKWPKNESQFELWGDAQSKASIIPNLKVLKKKASK